MRGCGRLEDLQTLGGFLCLFDVLTKLSDPQKLAGRVEMLAYGLANFAHDVLAQAEQPLKQRGCDVSPLL